MTTLFGPDTFTQSNGSAWSSGWTNASSTSGSFTDVQTNRGRMHAGSLTGYTGKCARRITGLSVAAAVFSTKWMYTGSQDGDLRLWVRADSNLDTGAGYHLNISKADQDIRLYRTISFSTIPLTGNIPYDIDPDVEHRAELSAIGTTIEIRVWPAGDARPATPLAAVTNSEITGAGAVGFQLVGGNTANQVVFVDEAKVTDGQGGPITLIGSAVGAGVLRKQTSRLTIGSAAGSGALTRFKVIVRTFTGSATPSGVLLRGFPKLLAGSAIGAGVLRKQASKRFAAAATGAGTVRRTAIRGFTGGATPTGALIVTWLGRLAGRPGIVQVTIRAAGWVRGRIRRL